MNQSEGYESVAPITVHEGTFVALLIGHVSQWTVEDAPCRLSPQPGEPIKTSGRSLDIELSLFFFWNLYVSVRLLPSVHLGYSCPKQEGRQLEGREGHDDAGIRSFFGAYEFPSRFCLCVHSEPPARQEADRTCLGLTSRKIPTPPSLRLTVFFLYNYTARFLNILLFTSFFFFSPSRLVPNIQFVPCEFLCAQPQFQEKRISTAEQVNSR